MPLQGMNYPGQPCLQNEVLIRPRVKLVDGCQKASTESGKRKSVVGMRLPCLADLAVEGCSECDVHQAHTQDFNSKFSDEILLLIFRYVRVQQDGRSLARVCRRWFILIASLFLQYRQSMTSIHGPRCISTGRANKDLCDGKGKILHLEKAQSEWRLAMTFLRTCKRHTHTLTLKDCTHISVRGCELVSRFATRLRCIRLDSCGAIDDASFNLIADRCRTLRSIHLSKGPKLTLKDFGKMAPGLVSIHLSDCRNVTPSNLIVLLQDCYDLKSLSISGMRMSGSFVEGEVYGTEPFSVRDLELMNSDIIDDFICFLSPRFCNLRKLNLSLCQKLSDNGISSLIGACGSQLQKLVMTRCCGFSDVGVHALVDMAASVRVLSLAGTSVTDCGLTMLLSSELGSKLKILSLACCSCITDVGLLKALKQLKLSVLASLDLQGCTQVSAVALAALPTALKTKYPVKICF